MGSSTTDAQAFLDRLVTDTDFRTALIGATSPKDKIAVIKDADFDFTYEELHAAMIDENISPAGKKHAATAVNAISEEDVDWPVIAGWLWPW
jgi:predicted ribosomally synthesized peptide with nif11-like leader